MRTRRPLQGFYTPLGGKSYFGLSALVRAWHPWDRQVSQHKGRMAQATVMLWLWQELAVRRNAVARQRLRNVTRGEGPYEPPRLSAAEELEEAERVLEEQARWAD
jgi:hypothetical protein